MKTFVLYHAHCADGFGAAFAAWLALGADGVTYTAVNYGEPLPEIPDGSRVYILDFSYDRETLIALAARTKLTVIDHHKTAAEALAGLPFATFDMAKSGAILAWEYFQGTGACIGEAPQLLLYVQDRDLWRWELPQSREFAAGLSLQACTFPHWHVLANEWPRFNTSNAQIMKSIIREGGVVLRYQRQLVDSIAARACMCEVDGHQMPVANTPVLISETCEELLRRNPEFPAAANFFRMEDGADSCKLIWSLRSRPECDVSEIARKFGGGGHRQAAGFTLRGDNLIPGDPAKF